LRTKPTGKRQQIWRPLPSKLKSRFAKFKDRLSCSLSLVLENLRSQVKRTDPEKPTLRFHMAEVSPALVKELREKTNAGMMDCKKALVESGGDLEKAEAILRKKGIAGASKKSVRTAKEGTVGSYIHLHGKVGVLVEVNCETDFVAKNSTFRELVKDITLHIAAAHPLYVSRDQVPQESIERERDIFRAQVQGKPEPVINKIVDGKLEKYFATVCLLDQAFVKNPDQTIRELVSSKIAEL